MEYLLLALAAGAMGVGWWWLGKRRKDLLGDSDDPSSLIPRGDPGPPEVLTRESLMGRSRSFDPRAWDDSPNGEASGPPPAAEEDLPSRFDRSYLERTSKRPPAPEPVPPRVTPPPAGLPDPLPTGEEDAPVYLDRDFLERRQRERFGPDQPPAGDPQA